MFNNYDQDTALMDKTTLKSLEDSIIETEKCSYYDPGMEFDSAMWLYLVTFLGTVSVIPGNVLTALFMQKIGRPNLLGGSMIVAGIVSLLIFFVQTNEAGLLTTLCLFNGVTIAAWCSILVLVCEAYGTDKRTTGLAALCSISKIAAILATVIYPGLINSAGAVGIITCLVAVGLGVYAQKMKDTIDEPLY